MFTQTDIMKFLNLVFVLIFPLFLLSQNNSKLIYLDEHYNEVDSLTYKKKCNSYFYKCLDYKKDSLTLKKVLYAYSFGKLEQTELNQIKSILKSDSNISISDDESIIIHFKDTLTGYPDFLKTQEMRVKALQKQFPDIQLEPHDEKFYQTRINSWIKSQKKFINKYSKRFPVRFLYIYNFDKEGLKNYKNFEWIKDNQGIVKNRFFKISNNHKLVLIKPNGNYFLIGGDFKPDNMRKLLKYEDWSTYLNNYELYKTNYQESGVGIFEH